MNRSPVDVVCDAGPLIHLDEVGCLDLLADFQTVYVPEQVWREAEFHRPGALERSGVELQQTSVVLSEYEPLQALVRALALDLGEQAALSLMMSHPDAILLTDDAAARLAAEALGYRYTGVLASSCGRSVADSEHNTRSCPYCVISQYDPASMFGLLCWRRSSRR